ncbi:L,D-transpeptidase family protein [Oleidesulfovibrio sp.]|uniref:L,D-transpeptidase family protein n=1 Tax=Oleidesulfovibrio sp. TaxID=2909707 RepID=UPI003A86535D
MTESRSFVAGLFFALLLCMYSAVPLHAQGWNADVNALPNIPPLFVAVDKSDQQLHVYEHRSPLTVSATYTCTTGQMKGDKLVEGDLRTPEGVYFVEHRIDKGLDWDLYGGIAYTLNYPNPMDKLRRKTGFGIWIHGRGHEITSRETQGCVALNMPDIEVLGPQLQRGLPVILAKNLSTNATVPPAAGKDVATATLLSEKSAAWADAWQSRTDSFFAFYDSESYTKSGSGNFTAFKSQKQRLFRTLPWIHTIVADVQVLKGPGYWVTWFRQFYRAPNLTTEGIRRLYWLQNAAGEWHVAGMEWRPGNVDMKATYLESMQQQADAFIAAWRKAWFNADVAAYAQMYASDAIQGSNRGISAIRDHKKVLWSNKKPSKLALDDVRVSMHHDGLKLTMTQRYSDSSGYSDKGVKTLVLRPEGDSWRIVREDWRQY